MRTNFGHLAFDGREYIDAPNYPVSRSWAEGYGYTDNSRRTPLMAQTAMRAYFQPSGDPVTFDLKEVNIPLQAYGEEAAATTPAATTPPAEQQQQQQGGQWDALINTVMKGVTTVAVGAYDASQQRKAAQAEAARADAAARQAAALQTVQGSGGGGGTGSGTTIAIVAVLGIAALGAVYFFSKSDGE